MGMRDLTLFFAALADENRLRLLHLLQDGETCVCYLQGVFQTNQPRISRHLAYLKRAGLVLARREGRWMHYRLAPLEGVPAVILAETLRHLRQEPRIRQDTQRLVRIDCCPPRYGLPAAPQKTAPAASRRR
jgi:ArsR family transcriptional regulator